MFTVYYYYRDGHVTTDNFSSYKTALYNAGEVNNLSIKCTRVFNCNGYYVMGFNWP